MLWDMKPPAVCIVAVGLGWLWLSLVAPVRFRAEAESPSQRAIPSPVAGIRLKQGLLSVDVREQNLRTILETIAAQGDIDVRHADSLADTRISLRFDAMPLVDGLKRLFRVANLNGYALITEREGGEVKVRRILFLAVQEGSNRSPLSRPSPARSRSRSARAVTPASRPGQTTSQADAAGSRSVFDEIKRNTTARRLLSQLVHPNEQVRDRALERLIRLVGNDEKQAELLEYLEPIMEQLASEDKADRDAARADIRKLLRR